MEKIFVIALHGFLGRPSDWDNVIDGIKIYNNGVDSKIVEWIRPDLFNDTKWGAGGSLDHTYRCIYNQAKILQEKGRIIILGYSMGGRLALGALGLDIDGSVFSSAILISVNPGLENELEKTKRVESDKVWSDKILKVRNEEGWESFLKEWNAQAVFDGANHEPKRLLLDYNLESLANAISNWSLGLQVNFYDLMLAANIPISWIVGERDLKFVNIANRIERGELSNIDSKFKKIVIEKSCHRVIFDQPNELSTHISII